jgi:hypothetical protein
MNNATSQIKTGVKGKAPSDWGVFPKAHENIKEDKS